MDKSKLGIMGFGVIDHSLVLNMERNSFRIVGYDFDLEKMRDFVAADNPNLIGFR